MGFLIQIISSYYNEKPMKLLKNKKSSPHTFFFFSELPFFNNPPPPPKKKSFKTKPLFLKLYHQSKNYGTFKIKTSFFKTKTHKILINFQNSLLLCFSQIWYFYKKIKKKYKRKEKKRRRRFSKQNFS